VVANGAPPSDVPKNAMDNPGNPVIADQQWVGDYWDVWNGVSILSAL
jgi:hypothetical protein